MNTIDLLSFIGPITMLKRAIIILFLLVSILPTVHAQSDEAPIFILSAHVLWTWADNSFTPVTDIWDAEMSPDGTQLAVTVRSPITIEAMNREGLYVATPGPTDIRIIDIATGQQTLIAEQPPDASYYAGENIPNKAILRSDPQWSPDGTHLAWTEADTDLPDSRLVVADLSAQTQRTIVAQLPDNCAEMDSPDDVKWGPGGLAIELYTCNVGEFPGWRIQLYDITGALLQEFAYANDDRNQMMGCAWVTYQSQDYLGVFFYGDQWDMLDPRTGDRLTVHTPPIHYSALNPDQSIGTTLYQKEVMVNTVRDIDYRWTVAYPGQPPLELSDAGDGLSSIAISPGGQRIAYLTQEGDLVIWQNGASHLVPKDSGASFERYARVLWSPIEIRVAPDETPERYPQIGSQG
jgi:hypothetical protein